MEKLSRRMFEERVGYACFWLRDASDGPGFFIPHSFKTGMSEIYQWIYKHYGKKNWPKMRKRGLRIMRVRFKNDGWIR